MRLKLFHAPDLPEALALVRCELGPDALILSTRTTEAGVEVTAALEPDDRASPAPRPSPAAPSSIDALADALTDALASLGAPPPAPPPPIPALDDADPVPDVAPPVTALADAPAAEPPARPAVAAPAPPDEQPAPAEAPPPARRPWEGPEERRRCLDWHGVPPALAALLSVGGLEEALAAALRFAPLPLHADGPPLLLLGPPGGGKTLSVARLATRLVLEGARPLVVTADSERAGAVEQLAAFTRLLELDLLVAPDPEALARAVARRDGGPVLVDGPALDPLDPHGRDALAALAAAAGAEPVLVLPTGLDPAEAQDLAMAHAECGARAMIATRLDGARRLGGVLAAAAAGRLALCEGGVGPGAADGLVGLTPALLAARLRDALPATRRAPAPATRRAAPAFALASIPGPAPAPASPAPFPAAPVRTERVPAGSSPLARSPAAPLPLAAPVRSAPSGPAPSGPVPSGPVPSTAPPSDDGVVPRPIRPEAAAWIAAMRDARAHRPPCDPGTAASGPPASPPSASPGVPPPAPAPSRPAGDRRAP